MNHHGQHFWVEKPPSKIQWIGSYSWGKIDQGDTCTGQNKSHLTVSQPITRWWHVLPVHLLAQVRGFQNTTLQEISVIPRASASSRSRSNIWRIASLPLWRSFGRASPRRNLPLNHFFRWLSGYGKTSEIFDRYVYKSTSSTRTSRGRKFPVYKKNINL